jgi:amidase
VKGHRRTAENIRRHLTVGDHMSNSQESKSHGRVSRRDFLALLGGSVVASLNSACSPELTPSPAGNGYRGSLHYASLIEVARLIESREISPVELTQMMLDRIDTVDVRLHSYATVMADHAIAAACAAEREIQSGSYRGPLHGVPIAVKDLCYTKGVPTMGGLKVLADFVPDHDATVVSKLEAAGAVLLGKLNLTEGAMAGYHRDFDIPVNPWGEELWAGASSSGSGVATAAGLCFASLGTDTGGSIRFPAMANGIVGLKPTYGRVSRYGVLPLAESLDHVGPITRCVADAAIVLETIAGFDPNDPTSLKDLVPNLREELGRGIEGIRIGFDRAYAMDDVDAGLASAIKKALGALKVLGAEIIEVQIPDVTEVLAAWPVMCSAEAAKAHRANYPSRADEYGAYFREFLELGAGVSDAELANARRVRTEFADRFAAVLSRVDAVLCPAGPVPFAIAREVQYGSLTELHQAFSEIKQSLGIEKDPASFTYPLNFAGTPGLALPCGISDQGPSYTMQLVGRHLTEPMLCRIGHAYEEATEWHKRHPYV